MKRHLALIATVLSLNLVPQVATAACPELKAWPERPPAPDGRVASQEEMSRAGDAVREYVATIEHYLDCRPGRTLLLHNRMVELAEKSAEAYNLEVRHYNARQEAIAAH
ncbi:MAG: hypothetical protein AAGI11_07175 [Pseudomonadota bacterium]